MNNDEVLAKYGPINEWDVSAINDISNLFYDTSGTYSSFNEDISNWDVSNVTKMFSMFKEQLPLINLSIIGLCLM